MLESADRFLSRQIERLRQLPTLKRIVFPEGDDPRVRAAAGRLAEERLVEPVLLSEDLADMPWYAHLYLERRHAKGATKEEADEKARNPLYRAGLMVAAGDADGAVGGATHTTADTVRAALQCVGMAHGIQTVSGVFLVCVRDRNFGHEGVL